MYRKLSIWRRAIPPRDAVKASGNRSAGQRGSKAAVSTLLSVVLHLVVLLTLARITLSGSQRLAREIEALMHEVAPVEETPLAAELKMAEPDERPHESLLAADATSIASLTADLPKVEPLTAPVELQGWEAPLVEKIDGIEMDDVVVRKGSAGEAVATVEGAVDRLTHEIVTRLEEGKLLVAWLMDASISLVDDRQSIADRLERVFGELGELGSLQGDHLVNAVVGFGLQTDFLLAPTNDAAKIIAAIRDVPIDESGVENVCSAVIQSLDRYKSLRSQQDRAIMMIVWTDESGDDHDLLEKAIHAARRLEAPVFVVGPPAVFGRQKGMHAYHNPDDGQTYPIEVDRGPDSARCERLRAPYWFDGPQYEQLHAGIGPYALTRLAVETGGAYFISGEADDPSPFALATMRRYMPDYAPLAVYDRQAQASRLRQAILRAVEVTLLREIKGTPRLEFEPTGENFQDQLREAQQSVAFSNIALNEALAPFGAGLEGEYAKEASPRWRAWYDLTYGRLLALQVRCHEYNWACAEMKGKGADFVDKQSNRWRFKPADKIRSGAAAERQAAEARRLLERCLKENPGTPWETLAKRELAHPLGFEIEERYVPPIEERMLAGPNAQPRGRRVEQLRELPRPRPPALPRL